MFFVQLGHRPAPAQQGGQAAGFAPLTQELIKVAFGDAEHFRNLFVSAKLLINGSNNLLTQFDGICFHIPYINDLLTHVKTAVMREALTLTERRVTPESVELVTPMNNLATVHWSKKDHVQSEALLRRVIKIFELGKTLTTHMATAYSNWGTALSAIDKDAEAEAALNKALEIYDGLKFDAQHPIRGTTYISLASCQAKRGDYAQAEASGLKALGMFEKSLSPEHPSLIGTLINLSATYRGMGRIEEAIALRERANELREKNLRRNLTIGSERQKSAMLAAMSNETNDTLSLHAQFAPDDPRALQLAFTTWLRRKGRALDEMRQGIEVLRRAAGAEATPIFERLAGKLSEYEQLARDPAGLSNEKGRAALKKLDEEIEQLKAELSARSARFRVETQSVKLEDTQKALPPGSALVEFARYAPVEARTRKQLDHRYLAYVLLPQGAPQWVELGDAREIDRAVAELQKAIVAPLKADFRAPARRVDELVMQPVRKLCGDARQIFISPDGSLNLVPFAALIDERNQHLVKNYLLIYLTSGRDLLRLQVKHQGNPEALIFADPDYSNTSKPGIAGAAATGQRDEPAGQTDDHQRRNRLSASREMNELKPFEPLAFGLIEAKAVRARLPGARLYTRQQASESALKQASRPRVLHIITHGFFLKDPGQAAGAERHENSLLRSGLALAGANRRSSGNENGILTALEATALDLWGTKLVVLSGCQTGSGEVKNGEGVYGLRRALALAGAETQLMSLWDVNDEATKNLMSSYYRRLRRGAGRAEALQQAQLEMLNSKTLNHPYFWASFVQIGEWANLDGK